MPVKKSQTGGKRVSKTAIVPAVEPEKRLPPPPTTRLNSLNGVKSHLVWVIKALEAGLMEPKTGNAITQSLNVLSSVIVDFDLESRIEKLEEVANNAAK